MALAEHAISVVIALCLAGPEEYRTRTVLREHVDAQGRISETFAEQTGWLVARGFHWQFLLDNERGGFSSVRPDQTFPTERRFKIVVEPFCDLWVYVLNHDPAGNEAILLPERGEEHLRIKKGHAVTIPTDGWFRFVDPPGTETFRIIASPERLTWANPRELFELEAGKHLDDQKTDLARYQKQIRTKSIEKIQDRQQKKQIFSKSLKEVIDQLRSNRPLRGTAKDTMVVPPPEEDVQLVLSASPDRDNRDVVVYDIQLRHKHR